MEITKEELEESFEKLKLIYNKIYDRWLNEGDTKERCIYCINGKCMPLEVFCNGTTDKGRCPFWVRK